MTYNDNIDAAAKALKKRRTPTKTIITKNSALECPYKATARCSKLFFTLAKVRQRVKKEHRQLDSDRLGRGTQKVL